MNNKTNNQYTDKTPDSFLFIIGAMKSGTTSLFDILGQHPEICQAKNKEPGFFVADRDNTSLHEYLDLWSWDTATHKYALESSVSYTQFPSTKGVPERMAQMNLGDYRFIYFMRNPLTRIESHVRHGLFAGWGKSLDDEISDDLINFSRYAMQLDEYLKYFPKESICPIVLEEFKEAPHQVLKNICSFLEIDEHYNFNSVEEPRNSGEFFDSSPLIRQLSQSGIGTLIIRKLLPFRLKNLLRKKIAGLGRNHTQEPATSRWKLTDNEKNDIIESLSPDLKRLQEKYGIDFQKHWKIPKGMLD